MPGEFIYSQPKNFNLQKVIHSYFYVDSSLKDATQFTEQVIPFPRVTFGYFFDAPFKVKNLSNDETLTVNIAIAKLQNTTVEVTPTTNRIRILGAHLQPYALSSFTNQEIADLPWLINPFTLFDHAADEFVKSVNSAKSALNYFDIVESAFLDIIILRDLELITEAIKFIEKTKGECSVDELAKQCTCSDRTLRNHFFTHIGSSPKEIIKLTKIKCSLHSMLKSRKSLTNIAYDHHYADQAHFINTMKSIKTDKPSDLRKKLPSFRFLQF